MTPRIAIWAAVSTPEQATVDKDSLPGQIRDGKAWAATVGDVVATYEVPGHSRQYIHFHDAAQDMDAYAQLERDCADEAFDVLWCRERSRLGRTRALIHTVEAIVANSGAEVYSAKTPHQIGKSSHSQRTLISSIEAWQAEDEIAQLQQRHNAGMRARVLRGLPPGTWPYGYRPIRNGTGRVIGGEFAPGEIGGVEVAALMFLEGQSYEAITIALNESPYRPRRSNRWTRSVVKQIMSNDFYAGYVRYRDIRNKMPSDKFPALWDEGTHSLILQEHERRTPGGSPYVSILSGCVFCVQCGKPMSIHRPMTYCYFRCSIHARKSETGVECHVNYVPEDKVIDTVETALNRIRELSRDELIEMLSGNDNERESLTNEQESIERAMDKDREALGRLAQAVAAGALGISACAVENDKISGRLSAAQKRLDEIEALLRRMPSAEERARALSGLVDLPIDLYETDTEKGRRVLELVNMRVWCENGQIRRVEIG